jgi:hypothetical protein
LARSRTTFAKGHTFGFKPGQSGNPTGRKPLADDIHALARPHAAEAIAGLVEFMRQREDCHLAMSAMIALLDRGYGRPPQALQVGGNEPMVVKYDIRWADAGTNSFPEERKAPTIDAAAADAEEVEVVWADRHESGPT